MSEFAALVRDAVPHLPAPHRAVGALVAAYREHAPVAGVVLEQRVRGLHALHDLRVALGVRVGLVEPLPPARAELVERVLAAGAIGVLPVTGGIRDDTSVDRRVRIVALHR